MTVKQLLDSLSFDEIAPSIIKRYGGGEEAESVLADYKQFNSKCYVTND